MYESTFDLNSRPFASTPQVECYFPASAIEQSRLTLSRTIDRAEGPGFLVGPAGTGKSLVCQLLAEEFRSKFVVAMLSTAQLSSSRALLQNILFELGLPYHDGDESDLRLRLTDYLEPSAQCPHGMLLLVDEAHMLPLAVLEEIRMLTNMARQGAPRVRLVLAGGPDLEEQFTSPKLTSFSQRIAARCYLHSLSREETTSYVQHQIRHAGGDPENVFTPDAIAAIYTATDGIPRLINQVCDHALMLGALGGHVAISDDAVQEAWSDLQQLPTPWQRDEQPQTVIEFGSLTGEEESYIDDPVAAIEDIQQQIHNASESTVEIIEAEIESEVEAEIESEPSASAVEEAPAAPVIQPAATVCVEAFTEDYEEEEVVIDHYAAMAAGRKTSKVDEEETCQVETHVAEPELADDSYDAVEVETEVESQIETEDQPELTVCVLPQLDEAAASQCDLATDGCDITLADTTSEMIEMTETETLEEPVTEHVEASEEDSCDVNDEEVNDEELKETVELPEGFPVIGYVDNEGEELLNPADDPVMPEFAPLGGPEGPGEDQEDSSTQVEKAESPVTADDQAVSLATVASAEPETVKGEVSSYSLAEHDDRDLIIVDEENASSTPPAFRGRARRQEYAQLFAKLRRG